MMLQAEENRGKEDKTEKVLRGRKEKRRDGRGTPKELLRGGLARRGEDEGEGDERRVSKGGRRQE